MRLKICKCNARSYKPRKRLSLFGDKECGIYYELEEPANLPTIKWQMQRFMPKKQKGG